MKNLFFNKIVLLCCSCLLFVNAAQNRVSLGSDGFTGLTHSLYAGVERFGYVGFNLWGGVSTDPSYVEKIVFYDSEYDFQSSDTLDTLNPKVSLHTYNLAVTLGLFPHVDFSANVPILFDKLGKWDAEGGIGDIEAGFRIGMKRPKEPKPILFSILTNFSIPTGDKNKGYFPRKYYYLKSDSLKDKFLSESPYAYFTSGNFDFETKGLLTFDFRSFSKVPLRYNVNGGFRIPFNPKLDKFFPYALSMEVIPSQNLALFTEFSGEFQLYSLTHGFKLFENPVRITPGIVFFPKSGFRFSLGGDLSLAKNKRFTYIENELIDKKVFARIEPKWRLHASIGWIGSTNNTDTDKDDILDFEDKCPDQKEDLDGVLDNDGCPEVDGDGDGILDQQDRCPLLAEDIDGKDDQDGCPDLDADMDGIPDTTDKCLDEKEDRDYFKDDDGCPDRDNDNDGVLDSLDKCVMIPEDIDLYDDYDGCPDPDNDMDGVLDSLDKCPNTPGTRDEQGCPPKISKAKEIKRGRVILKGVEFETGRSIIKGESYILLDQLVESLKEFPLVKIEIRCYTDNQKDTEFNNMITLKQAEVIRNYLIDSGIDPSRLVAVGKGERDPIANNNTAEGRFKNNRVEIFRID